MQNLEDIKSLEKLQRGNSSTQVQGMTDMAVIEEQQLEKDQNIKQAKDSLEQKL